MSIEKAQKKDRIFSFRVSGEFYEQMDKFRDDHSFNWSAFFKKVAIKRMEEEAKNAKPQK